MGITNYSHVAIGVRDIDRSLTFYRDVLGLTVAVDEHEKLESFGESGATRRATYLRFDDDPRSPFLVLDEVLGIDRPGEPKRPFKDAGIHHFGFWVDDVEAIVKRAKEAGADILLEPTLVASIRYGLPPGDQVLTALVRDPDGNAVQLDERL